MAAGKVAGHEGPEGKGRERGTGWMGGARTLQYALQQILAGVDYGGSQRASRVLPSCCYICARTHAVYIHI